MADESNRSGTLAALRDDAIGMLHTLGARRARDGWDGIDTFAVSPEVIDITEAILLSLPPWCPTPKVGTDRDGAPELEWTTEAGFLKFSVGLEDLLVDWALGEEFGQATIERMDGAEGLPVPLLGFVAAMFLRGVLLPGRGALGAKREVITTTPIAMAFRGNRRL